ncbi:MAG: metallophosphoesterase family protein, partial [Thiovulaceae bacterium]|nr:metallophosphoesterase family protein [Sulfurimonadaceae bacterium]
MKIGILSDTHKKEKRSQQVIDHLLKNGAEFLIHGGDIVKEQILEQLAESGLPYLAVYGNNDAHLHAVH